MIPPATFQIVLGAANFTIAVVWAFCAQGAWKAFHAQHWRSGLTCLLPLLSTTMAVVYLTTSIFTLMPANIPYNPPLVLVLLYDLNDIAVCIAVALFRHLIRYFSLREARPTRAWLAVNYGVAGILVAFVILAHLLSPELVRSRPPEYQLVIWTYVAITLGVATRSLLPLARGSWRPGAFAVARRPDALILLFGMLLIVTIMALHLTGSWSSHREALSILTTLVGVAVATPFAVRILGDVVRGLLLLAAMLGAICLAFLGAAVLDMRFSSQPALRPLVVLATAAALALIVGPWRDWLEHALELAVSRRTRHRRAELQRAVHDLSPELGLDECCRRGLRELNRIMQLRGSAILLREGGAIVEGQIAADGLDRVWPRALAESLRGDPVVEADVLWSLPFPVREALHEADAVRVVALCGNKRLWGHLVVTTHLISSTFAEEDVRAIAGFADQLALVLDGVELLERAIRVERSLAHSEKLAAIGELAARMAHEIRNPVTAARSLAQLMVRDPTSVLNSEHAELILAELERVERQVAALLRFARREDLRLEPVDLSELVSETADALRTRADDSGVELAIDAEPGRVVSADRERLRQVLINLIENALDALGGRPEGGAIRLRVAGRNGKTALSVSDNGPGVPTESLSRLFEPFFSLKHNGTGLGLAIVKRTVEAHGGSIEVAAPSEGGLAFLLELPGAGAGAIR